MSQPGNIFGALLAGTLIGGMLGILFYSSRSKGLRRDIVNKTQAIADQLTEKIEEGKSLLTDLQKRTEAAKAKVTRAMQPK